eukprot:TRINITY_DN1470_c0_g1_i4.p1 TRINITY_DN1470_c0_g1~~TRINITY_DN1470_c0_g1_i4.p1  ORF type:complete len:421 (-),score=86.26 TRINITY_DN1470_c0_g1_i4:221-1483(-)
MESLGDKNGSLESVQWYDYLCESLSSQFKLDTEHNLSVEAFYQSPFYQTELYPTTPIANITTTTANITEFIGNNQQQQEEDVLQSIASILFAPVEVIVVDPTSVLMNAPTTTTTTSTTNSTSISATNVEKEGLPMQQQPTPQNNESIVSPLNSRKRRNTFEENETYKHTYPSSSRCNNNVITAHTSISFNQYSPPQTLRNNSTNLPFPTAIVQVSPPSSPDSLSPFVSLQLPPFDTFLANLSSDSESDSEQQHYFNNVNIYHNPPRSYHSFSIISDNDNAMQPSHFQPMQHNLTDSLNNLTHTSPLQTSKEDTNGPDEDTKSSCSLPLGEGCCIFCQRGLPPCSLPPSWSFIMKVTLYTLHHHFKEKTFFSLSKEVYPFIQIHWNALGTKGYAGNWKRQIQDILLCNAFAMLLSTFFFGT